MFVCVCVCARVYVRVRFLSPTLSVSLFSISSPLRSLCVPFSLPLCLYAHANNTHYHTHTRNFAVLAAPTITQQEAKAERQRAAEERVLAAKMRVQVEALTSIFACSAPAPNCAIGPTCDVTRTVVDFEGLFEATALANPQHKLSVAAPPYSGVNDLGSH